MASPLLFISFIVAFSYPSSVFCRSSLASDGNLRTYIVHVRHSPYVVDSADHERWHRSFLPAAASDSDDSDRLVYSYSQVFSGFAARLTESELAEMAKREGFVRAYPDRIVPLLTTHTPDFLGISAPGGLWNASSLGKGVIVGVLDSGIMPGHPSFSDDGVPPPPARWEGKCDFGKGGCNNKIIGARSFSFAGSGPPTDEDGHGSHTASTIAGNFVKGVDPFGLGAGTTAGMAPHAHLAIYKVCAGNRCHNVDILAALDAAVKDGVDVLSLSLGQGSVPYDLDPIAIGSFAAIQKGITVVCAAGNEGPALSSVTNEAPWTLTVAASSVDRSFRSTVKLGNGKEYSGEALFQPANFSSNPIPLVYGTSTECLSSQNSDLMDNINVVGKIAVCDGIPEASFGASEAQATAVKSAGGFGIIAINAKGRGYTIIDDDKVSFLRIRVSFADGEKIKEYIKSVKSPTASIVFNGTVLGVSPAPVIASFSSRGPSNLSPGILKPDVSAPGLNIIAAWNQLPGPNSKSFNIDSGTSMATPHVSGIAALIKSLHPDWSPAAIKSAIITSSNPLDRDGNRIMDEQHNSASFFATGAGHVNPVSAAEPGLVYDLEVSDYIAYLCSVVGDAGVSVIAPGSNITCKNVKWITDSELNYPTITVAVASSTAVTVTRTVTNVGAEVANYTVQVDVPQGVKVTVKPETLQFSKENAKQSFSVTVEANINAEGNLKWVSGKTIVRSALVIITKRN